MPNRFVVMKISNALGIAPAAIASGEVESFDELAVMVGAKSSFDGEHDLTAHEKALVRCLRVCEGAVVVNIANEILKSFEENKFERSLLDILTFENDYVALSAIAHGDVEFERGITVDTLDALIEKLGKPTSDDQGTQ